MFSWTVFILRYVTLLNISVIRNLKGGKVLWLPNRTKPPEVCRFRPNHTHVGSYIHTDAGRLSTLKAILTIVASSQQLPWMMRALSHNAYCCTLIASSLGLQNGCTGGAQLVEVSVWFIRWAKSKYTVYNYYIPTFGPLCMWTHGLRTRRLKFSTLLSYYLLISIRLRF